MHAEYNIIPSYTNLVLTTCLTTLWHQLTSLTRGGDGETYHNFQELGESTLTIETMTR